MRIIKRNGSEVLFNLQNIIDGVSKANQKVDMSVKLSKDEIKDIAKRVKERCKQSIAILNTGDIQKLVKDEIHKLDKREIEEVFTIYRYEKIQTERKNTTDDKIIALLNNDNEVLKQENANKNPKIMSVMRDYMAGEVSKDISRRYLLPTDVYNAHKDGIIHFHDMDYFAMPMYNCCLINLDDMLQNGTVISGTSIDRPKSFSTACNIASQIVAQVASSQYGGQTISAYHLSKFVEVTRQSIRNRFKKEYEFLKDDDIEKIVEKETLKDIKNGIQILQYQLITLQTSNGQTPFVSLNLYLNEAENEKEKEDLALVIEAVLRQRIQGVKNENGTYYANPFPKLIYVLEEDNIHEDSKYYYLTKIASECTAKRMVPDYVSEKIMLKLKIDKNGNGNCYPPMGCRSFLTPFVEPETKKPKYYGRFNMGVVTINLPDVALSSNGDLESFWSILEDRLELCHRALRVRHERLKGTNSDVAPIIWQNGAVARLGANEPIDKYLFGGYSTISLGYAGLYETVYCLSKKSLTDKEGIELGREIMKKLNDKCLAWKKAENIDYSVYGTPIENTTEKFAKALQKRFGVVEGVSDKNYITNSYHVPVFQEIDAFTKIHVESELQDLSPGGAISYIETANMINNLPAILTIIKYIYDNIMYCEINCELDWCHECGGTGTIKMEKTDLGKLIWKCDNCGNEDLDKMNVVRRLCGYLSNANDCAQGRMEDIGSRVKHI